MLTMQITELTENRELSTQPARLVTKPTTLQRNATLDTCSKYTASLEGQIDGTESESTARQRTT